MIQRVRVDVPAGEDVQELLFWQPMRFSLDEVDTFVLQRRWPVRVGDKVPGEVLADHQFLVGESQGFTHHLYLL